ncbi:MAG: LarC family nickel insertion protein, partial [Nitrospira sp.]|nr:LarC family nickel insertion protein [Nitrospira sp.]
GVLGCHLLDVTRVTASPINVGAGTIHTSHGLLPVPGPAVAALSKGIPVYSDGPRCELATPTGMALLRTLSSEFGSTPVMNTAAVGYGAGDQDPEGWPNVLRVFLSEATARQEETTDRIMQLETNLDDLTPQAYEHVMDRLFDAGALDVALIPAIMKRSRPGIVLSCLAPCERADAMLNVLFQETTALGIRTQELSRRILPRRFLSVKVHGGTVNMKIATIRSGDEKAAPEYADCKAIADRTGIPLKKVMEKALHVYCQAQERRRTS